MNTPDLDEDFVSPNPKARIFLLVVILLLFGLMVFILSELKSIQPSEEASPAQVYEAIHHLETLLSRLLSFSLIVSLLISLYFIHLSLKTYQSGRFPPPQFSVIRRTKIRRGQSSQRYAALSLFMALISWSPVVVLFYLQWIIHTQL